jgi:hypothetical protein
MSNESLEKKALFRLKPIKATWNPLSWPGAAGRLYLNTWKGIINTGKVAADIYADVQGAREDAKRYDDLVGRAKGINLSPEMYRSLEVEAQDLGYSNPKEYLTRLNELRTAGKISPWDLPAELRRRFLLGKDFSTTMLLIFSALAVLFIPIKITGNVVSEVSKTQISFLGILVFLFIFFIIYFRIKKNKEKQKKLSEIRKLLKKKKSKK